MEGHTYVGLTTLLPRVSLWIAVLIVLSTLPLYLVFCWVYNAYFHPLSKFPGPKLWATSPLFRNVANMRGQLDWSIKQFHATYGDVVRFSPDELSFTSEQAWKDIYGGRDHTLIKDPAFYGRIRLGRDGADSIFNADDINHRRVRKALSHAFSERALRDQEPFVKQYVDLLIEKLKDIASSGHPCNMVHWYDYTTFDIIGDLAIDRSFDCLRNNTYHSWVSTIFAAIKMGAYVRTIAAYTDIQRLFTILAPQSLKGAKANHERYVIDNTQQRLQKGLERNRPDFISYILKKKGTEEELSDKEIEANANFLLLAGSETSGTGLSGTTYYLTKTPDALRKAVFEVRSAFESEESINFINCGERLPYLSACLTEGLRLYPPGPMAAPRRTPRGIYTQIDGYSVPEWTAVGVHALTAHHNPKSFHRASEFIPERWLPCSTSDPSSPFYNDCRGASQPFSTGPRNCLGKSFATNEMKLILARVLWNFDLELQPESHDWYKQNTYILWEKRPLMCKVNNIRA